MALATVRRGRDEDFTITITESNGNNYAWAANDVIRIKIGITGETPVLDLSSKQASGNGSSVSKANPTTVELRAADTTLLRAGAMDLEVLVVDDSDNDRIKHAQTHVLAVLESMGGNTGI